MPRTEAGRSLYADAEDYGGEVYYGDMAEWARRIDAIEAEARADEAAARAGEFRAGINAERARIRAAVERLPWAHDDIGLCVPRSDVLAILGGEDA